MDWNDFYNRFNFTGVNDEQGCNDIPNGFQDLDPQIFCIIGELAGAVMSGSLPFNIQNAIGNWLMLVGQTIVTYNAQQQYFQSGPGRFYEQRYRNVTNPFCNTSSSSSAGSSSGDVEELKKQIENLKIEIERLKNNY